MREAIASHPGKLYVMFDGSDPSPADQSRMAGAYRLDAVLRKLHLRRDAASCQRLRTLDTGPAPWQAFRQDDVGLPLLPAVTVCSVTRGIAFDSAELEKGGAALGRFYLSYFNRPPDEAGLQHWIAQYKEGMSLDAIRESTAASSAAIRIPTGSNTGSVSSTAGR